MRLRTESKLIALPEELNDVTARNILEYLRWQQQARILGRDILGPFKTGVIAKSEFGEYNLPVKETTERIFNDDAVSVLVTSKPPKTNVDWHGVYDGFAQFIQQLGVQHSEGVSREGVWTDEDTPFVELGVLFGRKETLQQDLTKTGKKPEYSVSVEGIILSVTKMRVIYSGRDYSIINRVNAEAYVTAQHLITLGKSRTVEETVENETMPRLYQLLKTDALTMMGGRPETKEFVAYVGESDLVFDVGVTPMTRPRYRKVVDALFKPLGKRIAKNSRIGELVLCKALLEDADIAAKLREKGLFTQAHEDLYRPRLSRRGNPGVSLTGVGVALDEARKNNIEEYESTTIELSLDSVVDRYV